MKLLMDFSGTDKGFDDALSQLSKATTAFGLSDVYLAAELLMDKLYFCWGDGEGDKVVRNRIIELAKQEIRKRDLAVGIEPSWNEDGTEIEDD